MTVYDKYLNIKKYHVEMLLLTLLVLLRLKSILSLLVLSAAYDCEWECECEESSLIVSVVGRFLLRSDI